VLEPEVIEELVHLSKMIRNAGKQLYGVVNDILDISKLELGRMKLSIERVPIDEVIAEVCEVLRPEAEKHHVTINHPALTTGTDIEADPLRLK